jgi:hypothetical protein
MKFKPGESGNEKTKWKPGESGNPSGRPRKIYSQLKDLGYSQAQAVETLQVLIALSLDELRKVEASEDCTALERIVAASIVNGHKKKSLYNVMAILERVYGKPKESQEHIIPEGAVFTLNIKK